LGFENIIEAIFALFITIVFLAIVIPALGEATGADMTFGRISMKFDVI